MSREFNDESAQEFLDKASEVEKQVKGIIDGSISIEEIDSKMDLNDKIALMKKREEREQEENKKKAGRKGKGHKGEYKMFCNF